MNDFTARARALDDELYSIWGEQSEPTDPVCDTAGIIREALEAAYREGQSDREVGKVWYAEGYAKGINDAAKLADNWQHGETNPYAFHRNCSDAIRFALAAPKETK